MNNTKYEIKEQEKVRHIQNNEKLEEDEDEKENEQKTKNENDSESNENHQNIKKLALKYNEKMEEGEISKDCLSGFGKRKRNESESSNTTLISSCGGSMADDERSERE